MPLRDTCSARCLVLITSSSTQRKPLQSIVAGATMMLSSCFIMRIVIGTDCVILCHCIGVHCKPLLIQLLAMLQLKLQ
jgi:hypothetical protein